MTGVHERDRGPDVNAFVDEALKTFTIATLDDTGELMAYDAGVYRRNAGPKVKAWVESKFQTNGAAASVHFVNEVVASVQRRTYVPRSGFNRPWKICLENGVLDLRTRTLSRHSPDQRFNAKLPVAYSENATCTRFARFLEEVLPDAKARDLVQEMFGYCFVAGNPHQKAFLHVGEGNNGKSTLLGVLRNLLGPENVASETLQDLVSNRFSPGNLWGKFANICADIPSHGIGDTGVFKMLTGGDQLKGEQKFRDPFYFVNSAKLIFSCNQLPAVSDRTLAFWRRWNFVRYPVTIPDDAVDPDLLRKLMIESPGILNWSLDGMSRIRKNGGLSMSETAADVAEDWKKRSDSLAWFVAEAVEADPAAIIPKESFYAAYSRFCRANRVLVKPVVAVGRELPTLAEISSSRRTVGLERVWCWVGIRLRKEGPP